MRPWKKCVILMMFCKDYVLSEMTTPKSCEMESGFLGLRDELYRLIVQLFYIKLVYENGFFEGCHA